MYHPGAGAPPHMMAQSHYPRRQQDYHYITPAQQYPPQFQYHPHSPYNAHVPIPHNPYMQPYYQPYPHYVPPPPRQFQHGGPHVNQSQPYVHQPMPMMNRQTSYPPPAPFSVQTPQPEPSTPSVSSQQMMSPSPSQTHTSISTTTPPVQVSKPVASDASSASSAAQTVTSTKRMPFYPSLPWFSVPESSFPVRSSRRRRKRAELSSEQVELPSRQQSKPAAVEAEAVTEVGKDELPILAGISTTNEIPVQSSAEMHADSPSVSVAPSELDSTNPTTPSSSATATVQSPAQTPKRTVTKGAILPIVPLRPVLPIKSLSPTQNRAPVSQENGTKSAEVPATVVAEAVLDSANEITVLSDVPAAAAPVEDTTSTLADTPTKAPPSSWAALFVGKSGNTAAPAPGPTIANAFMPNGTSMPKASDLAEVLRVYNVENEEKIPFLEPRGLVNTGNMCYMNSILQVLVFCIPFFGFLDQVGKRAVHSFKSDTPLVEAMIMFMREFNIIDSALNTSQLRLRLKDNELEQYGDAFIPEYVYDVIKRLPRFSSMRRGHQQDAEEFLGFLLEGLHDECVTVMKKQLANASVEPLTSPPSDAPDGWLEVGHKQKASVTHSSGSVTESPITKIFGGKLRSEFRVPGLQTSVTLEPYQPLQLDIGAADIHNITDALKGLTRAETITGNFNSPRGATTATKQVFIETLPPVLILHLKRFQYDNAGGTQKIWKKIGYPLELEIPKEVFSPHRRGALAARPQGLPKYRLISVVYHHGKNASGGHYTVDVRRQEGREWIRLDDTVIRRVRSDDVAGEGGEEDPKVLAKALEQHKNDNEDAARNLYAGFENGDNNDEDEDDTTGWSQVNGNTKEKDSAGNQKKWSSVATNASATTNGTATPSTAGKQAPKDPSRYSIKDNKVAYLLFYELISKE